VRVQSERAEAPPAQETEVPLWLDRELYPFDHHWLSTGAGRFHYLDEGDGDPILMVHGTPSWSFEYRHLVRALSPDHRCVAPDLLGFGLSERPRAFVYSPEAHAQALGEFVDALGWRRLTRVAHDFGGPISLPLALQGRVSRLIVLNSWMWAFDDLAFLRQARLAGGRVGRWLYRYANLSLRVLMPSAYKNRGSLTRRIHGQYLAPFRDRADRVLVLHALARALIASRTHYASLWSRRASLARLPTLLVWGVQDPAFGESALARWQEALPNAGVVRIEAGHWPHEESPAAVSEAIRAFLSSSVA